MRRRLATRLGHLLRSTTGGFNPANVMIGTVIGAIIMAASLFVVPGLITWAQDRDTRADLDKVRDAQRNALAVERVYLDEVALQDRGYLRPVRDVAIRVGGQATPVDFTGDAGSCYVAMALSPKGSLYWVSDSHRPELLTAGSEPRCLTTGDLEEMAAGLGVDLQLEAGDRVFPAPTMSGRFHGQYVLFTWNDTGAADYLVEYDDGTGWKRVDYAAKAAPDPAWTVGERSLKVARSTYPHATDIKARVASVNADGTTSPTSPVVTVSTRGTGNVLPNPGFERGLTAWHTSDDRAGITTSPTASGLQALRLPQGEWVSPAGVPGPGGRPHVDVTGMVQDTIRLKARVLAQRDLRVVATVTGRVGGNEETRTYEHVLARTSGPVFEDRTITITNLPAHSTKLLVGVTIHGSGNQADGSAAVIDDVELVVDHATVADLDELRGDIIQ